MKNVKREIFNCLGKCVSTNIIENTTVQKLAAKKGVHIKKGEKSFSIEAGPLLNRTITKYSTI